MIENEFRALLPLWLTSAAALLASQSTRQLEWLGPPTFVIGVVAVGAWAIGHEYSHRTMGALLTLPVPRARIWRSKLATVAPLLIALTAVAVLTKVMGQTTPAVSPLYYLPLAGALTLAPWLTLLTRSPLAGTVFTLGIAGTAAVIGDWMGLRLHGYTAQADLFRIAFLQWALGTLVVFSAVAGWIAFRLHEVTDGRGAEVHFPSLAANAGATVSKSHPLWLLVKKELRLQQLPCAVAAIYVVGYLALSYTLRGRADRDSAITLATVLYGGMLALLIGSLAAAEERHLGTHDAQLLLPVSSSKQWMVKSGTAMALTVLLAIVLPFILAVLLPPELLRPFGRRALIQPQTIALAAFTCSLAIYVSTLFTSGFRALLAAVAGTFATDLIVIRVAQPLSVRVYHAVWVTDGAYRLRDPLISPAIAFPIGATAIVLLILGLALNNYRWTERNHPRVAIHAMVIAASIAGAFALFGALGVR